jgi:hypothetical protein
VDYDEAAPRSNTTVKTAAAVKGFISNCIISWCGILQPVKLVGLIGAELAIISGNVSHVKENSYP